MPICRSYNNKAVLDFLRSARSVMSTVESQATTIEPKLTRSLPLHSRFSPERGCEIWCQSTRHLTICVRERERMMLHEHHQDGALVLLQNSATWHSLARESPPRFWSEESHQHQRPPTTHPPIENVRNCDFPNQYNYLATRFWISKPVPRRRIAGSALPAWRSPLFAQPLLSTLTSSTYDHVLTLNV